MTLPTNHGQITIELTEGRCDDCRKMGGGLVKVTVEEEVTEGVTRVPTSTLCGNCMAVTMAPDPTGGAT